MDISHSRPHRSYEKAPVNRVIIDDEADYATPNSKVNKNEKSKINKLTADLLGDQGTYIGVTATPARLDLNRTHQNQNEHRRKSHCNRPNSSIYCGNWWQYCLSRCNI